ncbi:SIR2 family protein [Flexivirga caeni]|uniref:Uncharacterized protein n=1 Tax=Flexivirga caeni TaxID=2294115 RepID=A0A3M9MDZ8_9MICO|nr:SIR2 family protein [Flexivirga caeni]RNI23779.1 hypothetical protein EFY87_05715 [Flexivirga caeni]
MSSDPNDDALLSLAFSLTTNPGARALILGAGVSMAAGIPSAWGVLTQLTERARAVVAPDGDDEDALEWYQREYGQQPQYQELLARVAPTQVDRQAVLAAFFEPTEDERDRQAKRPTAAHRAIARLVAGGQVRVIVTLNFDVLIETALREAGIEPVVVASVADAAGVRPLHTLKCCVVHLHGVYTNPQSMLNTFAELDHYDNARSALLSKILEDYGLIVAGWSADYDPALRDVVAIAALGRLSLTWCEPGQMSETAQQLLTLKGGRYVKDNADHFFGRLADAVTALESAGARHPLTVPVAVGTAKRELSGREVAIGVHDSLHREFDQLHELPEFQPPYSTSNFVDVRARIEEASSVCTALVAVLAYWGDSATDGWWVDQVPRFAVVTHESGELRMLGARQVTGTMLMYAAGIAAVAAQRFDLLNRLFRLTRRPHSRYDGTREYLAAHLIPAGEATPDPREMRERFDPILREALGLGGDGLQQYWQQFEVLRLAWLLSRTDDFEQQVADVESKKAALDKLDQAAGSQEQTEAWENWHRGLGSLMSAVRTGPVRVFVRDTFLGWDLSWRCPAADDLASVVSVEPSHPLNTSAMFTSPEAAAAALKVVSSALGRQGSQDQDRWEYEAASVVQSYVGVPECWLDDWWLRAHPAIPE